MNGPPVFAIGEDKFFREHNGDEWRERRNGWQVSANQCSARAIDLRYNCRSMEPQFIEQLRFRAYPSCSQWETLLRLERPGSPLANPDALHYLIPETSAEILGLLSRIAAEPSGIDSAPILPACDCGKNPYRPYYKAAGHALLEATVVIQARSEKTRAIQAKLPAL